MLASMSGGVANAIPVESVTGVENIQQNETATGVVKDALGETVIKCSDKGEPRSIEEISNEIYSCVKKYL